MKEVTGELNVTIIVAISIGVLTAFFFGFIWPALNGNFDRNASCKKAVCDCSMCANYRGDEACMCECVVDGTELECIYKG
ncbi:MAG: hypothetical protein E7172_03920 [Firmicutes bacterium]|nr:hypothetical protein [Bacillota bacterium]